MMKKVKLNGKSNSIRHIPKMVKINFSFKRQQIQSDVIAK